MIRTKIDKAYKTPCGFEKIPPYLKYELRQLYWKTLDIMEGKNVSSAVSDEVDNSLKKSWEDNGFIILKAEDPAKVDLVNEEIAKIQKHLKSKGQGLDDELAATRIVNTHSLSRVIFEFLCNRRLRNFLRYALHGEPVLMGSLAFRMGSEQSMHVDPQYIYTEPTGSFAGAWTALEDIHEDSGPFYYYEKSHINPIKVEDVLDNNAGLKQKVMTARLGKTTMRARENWDLALDMEKAYLKELADYWENSGSEKKPALLKKGDTMVWKQWLVHGGLPRKNPKLTRQSIAYHYCANTCKLWSIADFFLNSGRLADIPSQKLPIRQSRYGLYTRQYLTQIMEF